MPESHTHHDRGVTPVVGVILVLALTVLLAATAATFVLNLGDEAERQSAPTAAFQFEPTFAGGGNDSVVIEHDNGDNVATEDLYVVVSDAACTGGGDPNGRYNVAEDFGRSADLKAGHSIVFNNSLAGRPSAFCTGSGNRLDVSGATFRIVWQSPSGTGREIVSWTAP